MGRNKSDREGETQRIARWRSSQRPCPDGSAPNLLPSGERWLRLEQRRTGSRKAERRTGGAGRRAKSRFTRSPGIAGRAAGRNRRSAVRDCEHRAVFEGGSGAGLARNELQVPPALRFRGEGPGGAGQITQRIHRRGNGIALARSQTHRGMNVRALADHEEFAEAMGLQKTIWGFDDLELLPVRFFIVASRIGGQTFGAFDGSLMAGFLLALPGITKDGMQYL